MADPEGNGKIANAIVHAFDQLGGKVVGALHNLFGYQFSKNQEYFIYVPQDNPLALAAAAGSQASTVVEITQESDFICTRMCAFSRLTADPDQKPESGVGTGEPFRFKITDGSTDRQLVSDLVHSATGLGTANLPSIWPKPRLFTRNSNIRIDVTSVGNSGATEIFFAFLGWKIYDLAALDLTRRR